MNAARMDPVLRLVNQQWRLLPRIIERRDDGQGTQRSIRSLGGRERGLVARGELQSDIASRLVHDYVETRHLREWTAQFQLNVGHRPGRRRGRPGPLRDAW